jgi:ribosomal-protein-alanine N-acetyltransferase
MKLHSIQANIDPNNMASAAILKKFNFEREAYFKENFFFNGKFMDSEIYSLLNKQ